MYAIPNAFDVADVVGKGGNELKHDSIPSDRQSKAYKYTIYPPAQRYSCHRVIHKDWAFAVHNNRIERRIEATQMFSIQFPSNISCGMSCALKSI